MRPLLLLSLCLVLLAACTPGGSPELATLPDSWTRDGDRFWQAGTDTTGLFPNLDSLEAMGVLSSTGESDRQAYVERNLKRRLLVLYRQNPRVVDSLFMAHFPGWIANEDFGGSLQDVLDRVERSAKQSMNRNFRGPSPRLTLGEEIPYAFPDSLKQRVGDARVRLQVSLNAEGAPVAIELLDPINPTLDLIAVRAATQQRWSPILLNVRNNWAQIPGWVRYNVLFGNPDSGAGDAAS